MKIPYGESNFKTVLTGGYVYVDKTAYIRKLEEAGKYLFLLRPHRFGKSLFVSMLEHYYDVLRRDGFDALLAACILGNTQLRRVTAIRCWSWISAASAPIPVTIFSMRFAAR